MFKLKFKFDTKSYKDTKNLVFLGDWDTDRRQGSELKQRQPVIIQVQFLRESCKEKEPGSGRMGSSSQLRLVLKGSMVK